VQQPKSAVILMPFGALGSPFGGHNLTVRKIMQTQRLEHLLNVAYKSLNENMQEAYPLVDLDEAIGCIAEALAIVQGDHGSFSE
tara:strand:- start:451 stop:702 length:252 start_codon:yes stop_codon:yes gene_type:complete